MAATRLSRAFQLRRSRRSRAVTVILSSSDTARPTRFAPRSIAINRPDGTTARLRVVSALFGEIIDNSLRSSGEMVLAPASKQRLIYRGSAEALNRVETATPFRFFED